MALPQEIYDLIVAEVAIEDYNSATLCACAKASRVLLYPVYHLLFSHIRLTITTQNDSKVRDFISLLWDSLLSPDISIASYIRRFDLSITLPKSDDRPNLPDSELWKVLNNFTRVEHLKVSSLHFKLSFETHQCFLSRDFVDLCHSPTLSKISLSNFTDVPADLFHSCINHIGLSEVNFAHYPSEHRPCLPQPESIDVDFHSSFTFALAIFDHLFSHRQEVLCRLRTLDIRHSCFWGLSPFFTILAKAASDTLETLSLNIKSQIPTVKSASGDLKYFFHPFSRLRILRLFFTEMMLPPRAQTCLVDPLTSFLNLSTFPTSLQTLDICINSPVSVDTHYVIKCRCGPSKRTDCWRRLDSVLANPQIAAVPTLRLLLNFVVSPAYSTTDRREFVARTREGVQDDLPVFCQTRSLTGQLHVSCSDSISGSPFHFAELW